LTVPGANDGSKFLYVKPPGQEMRRTQQCDALRHLWPKTGSIPQFCPSTPCPEGHEPDTIGAMMPAWGWRVLGS